MLSSTTVKSYVFPDSSMVEQAAVNRKVVGSSPTRGAKYHTCRRRGFRRFFVAPGE